MRVRTFLGLGVAAATGVAAFLIFGPDDRPEWGLHIVFFSVGEGDAIALLADDGTAAVVDAGRKGDDGKRMAEFFGDPDANGVRAIQTVKFAVATHYDSDHINGFAGLVDEGMTFDSVFDQGHSTKRESANPNTSYNRYASHLFGDDAVAPAGRRRPAPGDRWRVGRAEVRVLSVAGDTYRTSWDVDLDPSTRSRVDFDENCGSIALLVRLGQFEMFLGGDQTTDDWRGFVDTELAVVRSGALGNDPDIDVFKANHHGSESSNGPRFLHAIDPEVAVISSELGQHHIPKAITVRELLRNGAFVYITGDALENDGSLTDSDKTTLDDGFTIPDDSVFNDVGDLHIYVSRDGERYWMIVGGEAHEFSSLDSDQPHTLTDADYADTKDLRLDGDQLPRCKWGS